MTSSSTRGEKVAGYRDEGGNLIAVSARCTHLGCQVNWNRAERSWDCPCHGSRFAPDGACYRVRPCTGSSSSRPGSEARMGNYGECRTAEVAAPPQRCFDALTDYERLPEWQGAVKAAHVLERDEQGRGAVVAFEVDAKLKTVRYRLRQIYEEPHRLASAYLGGDFRAFEGEWRFVEIPAGTRVELDLRIDPGRFVPGPLRGAISDAVMKRALRDLEAFVERPA